MYYMYINMYHPGMRACIPALFDLRHPSIFVAKSLCKTVTNSDILFSQKVVPGQRIKG